jgi:hypothetical protein
MARETLSRHLGVGFAAAILIYLVSFSAIEHLRTRKGGWQLVFHTDAQGAPKLVIAQPQLGISNVTVAFPHENVDRPNLSTSIHFDQPITNVPFGKVVYLDTTFLPGSIVLSLFGHQLQLLPRTLLVDGKEMPWRSGSNLSL